MLAVPTAVMNVWIVSSLGPSGPDGIGAHVLAHIPLATEFAAGQGPRRHRAALLIVPSGFNTGP